MAEVAAEFVIIDTFNGGNLEASYTDLNPTKTIPMIKQGSTSVTGSEAKQFYQHLLENHLRVKAMFY